MSNPFPLPATARLGMITDWEIEPDQLALIRQLFVSGVTDADLCYGPERRSCTWPCPAGSPAHFHRVESVLYECALFLWRRKEIVERLRQTGSNIQLTISVPETWHSFSLGGSSLRHLLEMDVLLVFEPMRHEESA